MFAPLGELGLSLRDVVRNNVALLRREPIPDTHSQPPDPLFDCSRSGNLRTVFGTRLRLLFAIGSGLRCRAAKSMILSPIF